MEENLGMTLPPEFNTYVSAAMFVIGAYLFALYVGLIVWTFRDIRARTRDGLAQIIATLLVAVFTLPGLLVYLLLRPHTTLAEDYERSLTEEAILQDLDERRLCPECQRHVEADFMVCPHCHHQLRLRCVGCGRMMNLNWDVCPYCGRFREQVEDDIQPVRGRSGRDRRSPVPALATTNLSAPSVPDYEPELPYTESEPQFEPVPESDLAYDYDPGAESVYGGGRYDNAEPMDEVEAFRYDDDQYDGDDEDIDLDDDEEDRSTSSRR
jgi:RNA polymerase subunit RPABC4/transcription elongation factor Spt4